MMCQYKGAMTKVNPAAGGDGKNRPDLQQEAFLLGQRICRYSAQSLSFPFLCDQEQKAITELDIVDMTDANHPRIAIPYTFLLDDLRLPAWLLDGPEIECGG
jgi:hypothetical protein